MILYNYYHLCVCRNHFYSFTETDSEYSLVLDDDLFTGELYLCLFVIYIYNYVYYPQYNHYLDLLDGVASSNK